MKTHLDFKISERDFKILSLLNSLDEECLNAIKRTVSMEEIRRGDWSMGISIEKTNVITRFTFHSKDTFNIYRIEYINPLGDAIGTYPMTLSLTTSEYVEETEEFEDHYELADKTVIEITADDDREEKDFADIIFNYIL